MKSIARHIINRIKLLTVFSIHGALQHMLLAIIIVLVTALLGATVAPLLHIVLTEKGLKKTLPNVERMIYATRAYEAPEKLDFQELAASEAIEDVFFTGSYYCALPSGERAYLFFLSPNLFDSLTVSTKGNDATLVFSTEAPMAICSNNAENIIVLGQKIELTIVSSHIKIEKKDINVAVYPKAFLKRNISFPALIANNSSFRTIDNISSSTNRNDYICLLAKAGKNDNTYLDDTVALLQISDGYEVTDVLTELEKKYGRLAVFESYRSIVHSSYEEMLLSNESGLLRFLIILLIFLAVNVFGTLLISRQNQKRTDMILYQAGLTRGGITKLHMAFTIIISAPWIIIGVLLAKPIASALSIQGSQGYTIGVLIAVAICYFLVLIVVGVLNYISQKQHSASEIYKET